MLKKVFAAAAALSVAGGLLLTAAPAANAMTPANVSKGEYIAAIEEIMPSLRDQYTDKQLVSLGKETCKYLNAGGKVRGVDKIMREYLTNDESMALVGLSVAAFCDQHWTKVERYYDL